MIPNIQQPMISIIKSDHFMQTNTLMLQLNSLNNPIINSKQNPKHFLSLFIINFLIENNKRGNHLFISLTFFYLKLELKLKSLVYI
jgi:hypothetical protein